MSTNTSLDIDAIETRLAMASPGPWRVKPSDNGSIHRGTVQVEENGRMIEVIAECYCGASEGHGLRNAEMIAHAPEDLEALIEEVKRLRKHAFASRWALRLWAEGYDRVMDSEGFPAYTKNMIRKTIVGAIRGNEPMEMFEGTILRALDDGKLSVDSEDVTLEQIEDIKAKYIASIVSGIFSRDVG